MRKHIVCFGDSNTHGCSPDTTDCADGGWRFSEEQRWTCRLQKQLGDDFLVSEEGLAGRTTVFRDPMQERASGLDDIYTVLMTHEPVDLLIIMLGTNDTKERFGCSPEVIGNGLELLVRKAQSILCWRDNKPNILIVSPPAIGEGMLNHPCVTEMGKSSPEKSRRLAEVFRLKAEINACHFMDAEGVAEFNQVDFMHLSSKGHRQLADALTEKVMEIFSID